MSITYLSIIFECCGTQAIDIYTILKHLCPHHSKNYYIILQNNCELLLVSVGFRYNRPFDVVNVVNPVCLQPHGMFVLLTPQP